MRSLAAERRVAKELALAQLGQQMLRARGSKEGRSIS
jgi:hypothetical protein